jgi:WhiB family redox-sensing transcriptional regulator
MILERPDWQNRAACKGVPHEVFFPENPGGQESVYIQARNFCDKCSVTEECLQFALEFEQGKRDRFGMFGGLSPRQRVVLDKQPVSIQIRK